MKTKLLQRLDRLEKAFKAEGYEVDINLRIRPPILLFIVTLKSEEVNRISKQWDRARVIAGD